MIEELRRNRSQLIPQNDLLSRAMAREVGAVMLSSILTACHYFRAWHNHSFSQETVEEIGAVFARIEQTLAFPLPKIPDVKHLLSSEVIDRVNDLLKLCVLVWARFGLTQLHDLLNLRQVHFSAIALELHFDDAANVRRLIESLSSALERRDFVGLISNCILADCFQTAEDLSAQALCRAADLALQSNLGAVLKGSLALIAVEKAHAFGIDLSSFLEVLIAKNERGDSFFAGYLRNCPAHQACGVALRFLNAASNSKAQDFDTQVEQIALEAAQQMPQGPVREEIEALLDGRALHRAFQLASPVDSHQTLAKWVDRKHLWVYPTVLLDLLEHGQNVQEVRREALAVLDGHGQQDEYNSYYSLAINLAQNWPDLDADPAAAGKLVQYIKQDLPRWERISPAELNMRVYMVLERLEAGEREAYTLKIVKWQALHWEREHLKRLPNLVKQGQLFLVFEQYFRWMQFWGLGTDMNHGGFSELWSKAPHAREAMVAEWHMRGEIVPAPLAKQGNRWVVSSEFLLLGSSLFRPPLDADEKYHAARSNFNDAASRSFRDLIRLVVDLPNVPPNVSELLRVHAERLSTFSNPTESGSKPISVVA